MLEKSPVGLAALDAQIESVGAALREIGARLQTIKVTATTIHTEATRELQALKDTFAHRRERDDLDRIVPLKEAAKMRRVSAGAPSAGPTGTNSLRSRTTGSACVCATQRCLVSRREL